MIASTALKLLRLKPEYFFLGHPVLNSFFAFCCENNLFTNIEHYATYEIVNIIYFLGTNVSTTEPECSMRHNINTIESSSSLTDMHDEGINDNDSLASDVPDPFLVLEKPDPLVPEIAVTNLPQLQRNVG